MGFSERQVLLAFTGGCCPALAVVWRLRFATFLIGALLAGWLSIASAQASKLQPHGNIEQIDIVSHGIYEPMKGKLPEGVPQYTSDDVQLVGETNFIPAQLGIEFGFRYTIVGQPKDAPVAIKTVILFPPAGIVSPTEGLLHSASLVKTERIGRYKTVAYRIDKPWELVRGIWTIQLWIGSQKFAEQAFTIMPQQSAMN